MPRRLNYDIGERILDIIYRYRYEPLGIGVWYNQIQREGNLNSKTLTGWLKHLRSHEIVYTSKRFIRFTPKKLEEYEIGELFIPGVQVQSIKEKKKKILLPNSRLSSRRRVCHGILHVLFLNAHLITEPKPKPDETYIDKNGIEWAQAIHRPAVKADTTKKLERIHKKDNLYPPILENRIGGVSLELFRHLELSDAEAEEYYQFLKDYRPDSYKSYPILTIPTEETGRHYNNQTVYEMKDRLLQEFIDRCLIVFNSGIFLILRYYHKTNRFKRLKVEGSNQIVTKRRQIDEYEKYMDIWFGSKQAYHSVDVFLERSSLTNDDVDKRLKRAMNDIHKHSIFDDQLNDINKKYKILKEKYPDIIEALLDTLFPRFFRDIIREEYMKKNVTIKSNLSR